ncbi:ES2 protein [Plasmodium brasilianum]|uniref:ES2 protein, putative n=2 Tax=Plasmodium (Plasmodium) TaxID=418103 RepID=A0A1A8W265_PLAMA|nr:ES2 protein, putative [Plasmodium malariae]KAI4838234.1 ES2 protein [Plasmodium brasilianum]SBS85236.1 ES2 protein, putative [Plasmodium malariae]SCN12631.1 ES2 protein, putative [Plasmodium malariae]
MEHLSTPETQGNERFRKQRNSNENKIILNDEDNLKIIKKKKRRNGKRKKNESQGEHDDDNDNNNYKYNDNYFDNEGTVGEHKNEKIVLFENNEIVEYDASNFGTRKDNIIVLLEEDYLSVLEYLIEKKFFPDIHKLRNESSYQKSECVNVKSNKNNYSSDFEYNYSDQVRSLDNMLEDRNYYDNKAAENAINDGGNSSCGIMDVYKNNNYYYDDDRERSNVLCFPERQSKYKLVVLPNGKKHKINLNINLRDFQKRYTSEDNKSFEYLLRNMKNKNIEKNLYSIVKRNEHNLKIDQIEECTKNGIKCHFLNTNKSENESNSMMFSSSFKVSDVDSIKENKLQIYYDNTRFSEEYNKDMNNQINQSEQIKELKIMSKEKERIEDQMIEQGNFNLLTRNNQYEYVRTPLIRAGKGVDKSPIITWGKIMNTPKLIQNEENEINDYNSNDYSKINGGIKKKTSEEDDNEIYAKNEFNLQKINNREIIAEKLQNSLKNIKYNKELLKKKNLNLLINKNYSSRMSTTSFRNSILSRQSQKRLNKLAQKSSLASQILGKKKSS